MGWRPQTPGMTRDELVELLAATSGG
jgi:hypothetical protein